MNQLAGCWFTMMMVTLKDEIYLKYSNHLTNLLLVLIRICSAEPSSTTRYLMNERTSQLDFGLYKLEDYLQGVGAGDPYVSLSVVFDWNSNRIAIYVWNTDPNKFKTKNEAKDWCKAVICDIRGSLGIDCFL